MKVVSGTSLEEATRRFFEGAKRGLDDLRDVRIAGLEKELPRFFEGARQGLRILAPVVAELDRHLARRFSVFNFDRRHRPGTARYFHLDENRMSDVLADLLQPGSVHGQGALFLSAFLRHLQEEKRTQAAMQGLVPEDPTWSDTLVTREAYTTHSIRDSGKKIDIVISMKIGGESVAIAIENKPRAEDQPAQLEVYAEHLQKKYDGRYLLLYLTPGGGPPDPGSIEPHRRAQLEEQGRFACVRLDQWLDGWMREAESQVKASYVQHFVADFRQALLAKYANSEAGLALGPVSGPVVR